MPSSEQPKPDGRFARSLDDARAKAIELRIEAPLRIAMSLSLLGEHMAAARRRIADLDSPLVNNGDRVDALAMDYLVIVQNTLDLSFAIVQWNELGRPQSHAECFRLLAQNGFIDEAIAKPLGILARRAWASIEIRLPTLTLVGSAVV